MNYEPLDRLIAGYREFRREYVSKRYAAYRTWAAATQEPRVMMIACSDSRINPAILTHAGLGDVFVVNNVANLVPPYKEGKETHHSTSAALEFALTHLGVEHIIILGHSGCGGIKALMQGTARTNPDIYSFIGPWMDIARPAREYVLHHHATCSQEEKLTLCEKQSLLVSLENLRTFPWVRSALEAGLLALHVWHFDVGSGMIEQYDTRLERFHPLLESEYDRA